MSAAIVLTSIGLILTVLSLFFIAVGSIRKETQIVALYRDQQVVWTSTERNPVTELPIKSINFAFMVHHKCRCNVRVRSKSGPFRVSLGEIPMVAVVPGSRWELYSKFDARPSFQKSEENYSYDLEAGSHVLQFMGESLRLEAYFDLELEHAFKPFQQLVDPGLTLLTMALPILITGVVAALFGASLS